MASIRTKRQASTIRTAIVYARKQCEQVAEGWVGVQSGDLKGLYGRAYLRTWRAYTPKSTRKQWNGWPPGVYWGDV